MKDFAAAASARAALAAGRVAVEFTETPKPSTFPDMAKYEHGKVITSATGQLAWDARRPAAVSPSTPPAPRPWSASPPAGS